MDMVKGPRKGTLSKRLIFSYILDWVVILGMAAVAGGLAKISPNKRPFSLTDPTISYPKVGKEKVPNGVAVLAGFLAPLIVIFVVCLAFVPGPTVAKGTPRVMIWRRKFWEFHTGVLGLALALASSFLITNGMKHQYGKPRPDLLSRCNPDLNNIRDHIVGGFYDQIEGANGALVSWTICQNKGTELDDGFRSFFSGHASFSWAGLLYLTLFLCSKFAIAIPFLAPKPFSRDAYSAFAERHPRRGYHEASSSGSFGKGAPNEATRVPDPAHSHEAYDPDAVPVRNQAAAPPAYLLAIAFIPIGAAIYISGTRYSDFRHFGFDILFGVFVGIVTAWFSFRWYHLPIRQGAGWSWGARSRDRAFFIGLGIDSYVGDEGWETTKKAKKDDRDLESGPTPGQGGAGNVDGHSADGVMGPGRSDMRGGMIGPNGGTSYHGAGTAYQGADGAYQGAGTGYQGASSAYQGAGSASQGAGSAYQGAGTVYQGAAPRT
ncbi:MAG: hypothetical protein M1817_001714 [Caeruleum heppii]|nr:MAG: hypothetical protein M1817_001714 [Caeruleum heppii]